VKPSKISWTDFSGGNLNFATGCTPVSRGCTHCYARTIYERWGFDFTPMFHPDKLAKLQRQRFPEWSPKRGKPHKPMHFVCDTGDLFHEDISAAEIVYAWAVMAYRKDVIWQVLTKRPERIDSVLYGEEGNWYLGGGDYLPNVWLGVSVEDQATWDERVRHLLGVRPAAVRFVSVEPMLEAIDAGPCLINCNGCGNQGSDSYITRYDNQLCRACDKGAEGPNIDWVICGAESGPKRRPFDVAWAAALYEQCQEAGVAYFGKQASGLYPGAPLLIEGQIRQEWPVCPPARPNIEEG